MADVYEQAARDVLLLAAHQYDIDGSIASGQWEGHDTLLGRDLHVEGAAILRRYFSQANSGGEVQSRHTSE